MMKVYLIFISFLLSLSVSAQSKNQLDSLSAVLEVANKNDQQPRYRLDTLQKKYGVNSPEVAAHWKYMSEKDSINTGLVTSIIDRYGWLGPNEVSSEASKGLFSVIQHADVNIQIKYLPVLEHAVGQGKIKPSDFAYLSDRVKMRTGHYQTYGTQIGGDYKGNLRFWPIEDELNVNERRKSIGLETIQEYSRNFNINYKVPAVDSLQGDNIILIGFISDSNNKVLNSAGIYTPDAKLIAQTNIDGVFRAIIPRSLLKSPLTVRKDGFNSIPIVEERDQDVFYVDLVLTKK
jgi:hypothetical protein